MTDTTHAAAELAADQKRRAQIADLLRYQSHNLAAVRLVIDMVDCADRDDPELSTTFDLLVFQSAEIIRKTLELYEIRGVEVPRFITRTPLGGSAMLAPMRPRTAEDPPPVRILAMEDLA